MLGIVYYVHYIWTKYSLPVPNGITEDTTHEDTAVDAERLRVEIGGRARDEVVALGLGQRARAAAADPPMPRGILVAGPDDAAPNEPNEPGAERRARARPGTYAPHVSEIERVVETLMMPREKIARLIIITRNMPPVGVNNQRPSIGDYLQRIGDFAWMTMNFDRGHVCLYIENYVKKQLASSSGSREKLVNISVAVDWLAVLYELPPDADIFTIESRLM